MYHYQHHLAQVDEAIIEVIIATVQFDDDEVGQEVVEWVTNISLVFVAQIHQSLERDDYDCAINGDEKYILLLDDDEVELIVRWIDGYENELADDEMDDVVIILEAHIVVTDAMLLLAEVDDEDDDIIAQQSVVVDDYDDVD